MRYRITFFAGLAIGYVLGTAAGRERYEQLKKSASRVAQNPAVRNAAESAAQQGRQYAGKAFVAVGDHLPQRLHRVMGNGSGKASADDDWGTSNT
ncbi:YtxH domain-containing protein [Streptomyces sp. NPDC093225]|uniref:YtxH domain-containing protein n=1 Tax=Streptomyces sp. NPDC093225 TaxID=3366034 RepID=UPI003811B9FC